MASCLLHSAVQICKNLLKALQYCHCHLGIVHNDIKCNNVLLADHGDVVIKICDFGLATCGPTNSCPVFPRGTRSPRKPRVPGASSTVAQIDNVHYWSSTYTGTKLSGWDVDMYSFVLLCVTILFHDKPHFVLRVRNFSDFPPPHELAPLISAHPYLKDFFYVGQRFLQEREQVFDGTWEAAGGLLMQALGGKL